MTNIEENRKARDHLKVISQRIKIAYTFGKIQTFYDLLRIVGYSDEQIKQKYFPHEYGEKISFNEIKEWLKDREIELETSIWLKNNPPVIKLTDEEKALLKQSETPKLIFTEEPLSTVIDTSINLEKHYKLPFCSKDKSFLFWFQHKAARELLSGITNDNKRGQLLIANAGYGKTFIMGAVIARLRESNWHTKVGSIAPWPYIYVTKASVVEQTKRVFEKFFGLRHPQDILVINIDQLRSKFGELFVDEKLKIEHGMEYTQWSWRPMINPCFIAWDECQALKNEGTQQAKIAASFNELPNTYQIFLSATPFTKVSEAKCFCVATRIRNTKATLIECELENKHWKTFAEYVASPANPYEHSPGAMERLMDVMNDFIVRVKGVKPQFHAKNSVLLIDFQTKEGKEFYDKAIEEFLKKKSKAEAKEAKGLINAGQKNVCILVAMLQYRIAAESNPDRIKYLCEQMVNATNNGYAAGCAVNFKVTIRKCIRMLCEDYKIPREKISIIWGGGQTKATEKQKTKAAIEGSDDLLKALEEAGITMDMLSLEDVEAKVEESFDDETLKLGIQTLKERQNEIDRFQKGDSLYCFYTFRAGGVGLSLHHTDEFSQEKVRHKESGYAYEEDISKILTRPRKSFIAPTWSAIEMVQGLGRFPRLTSLSDTTQQLIFFAGTIEEQVAQVVSMKLKCLSKVVQQKESWEGIIMGGYTYEEKEPITEEDEEILGDIDTTENGK